MATRDFTDNVRENMLTIIENVEQHSWGLGLFNELASYLDMNDLSIGFGDFRSVAAFYRAVSDRNDEARTVVERVFANVYALEGSLAGKLRTQLDLAMGLHSAYRSLAEVTNPLPADGGLPMLDRPADELSQALGLSVEQLLNATIGRFVTYDESGNPIYAWDEIDRILDKGFDDWDAVKVLALAYIYLGMGIPDTEHFMQSLADYIGDEETYGLKYSLWEYDPNKVNALLNCMSLFDYDPVMYERQFAFLYLLFDLATRPGGTERVYGNTIEVESGNLIGQPGGYGPDLDLKLRIRPGDAGVNKVDYELTFYNTIYKRDEEYRHSVERNANTIYIGSPEFDSYIGYASALYNKEYIEVNFSPSDLSFSFLSEFILNELLGFISPETAVVVNFIKGATNALEEYNKEIKIYNDVSAENDNLIISNMLSAYGYHVVIIYDPATATQQFIAFETDMSVQNLEKLNNYIEETSNKLPSWAVIPVTDDDLVRNAQDALDILRVLP